MGLIVGSGMLPIDTVPLSASGAGKPGKDFRE